MNGKQLKNSILQWAIQGKLVPQDPNDEPASVLLERIRAEKAQLIKEGKIKKDKNETIIFRGDDNSHYEKLPNGEIRCIDAEIPFEIPNNWCWVRLGNLFSHSSGKALNGGDKEGKPYQYITTSNLYWNRFELDNLRTMNFRESELEKCTATKGDLLVCEGGDIGRAAIWNYDYDIKIQNHIHKLRAFYPLCTKFFYYIFFLYKHIGFIGGKGIGIQGLSSGALHQIILPIAPLNEQMRIVEKIDEIMPIADKYAQTQQELDNLNSEIYDLLKKTILQEAIQGRLVPQDPNDEPVIKLLERIRMEKQALVKQGKLKAKDITDSIIYKGDDNKYYEKCGKTITCIDIEVPFEIPESWQWMRISTLCKITNGFTPLRSESKYWINGTINWFTVEDIRKQGEEVNYTEQKITMEATTDDRIVRAGSTLLCCTASVGQCAITRAPVTTNQQFNALTIKDEYRSICDDDYLFLFAKTLTPLLHQLAGQTTFEFVSVKKVGNILFPLPPVEEQKRIVSKVNHALASIMSR